MKKDNTKAKTRSGSPLEVLGVIDRLEIGPVRLQRKKLLAPYTVIQNDRSDVFELEYSFEEDVFDPDDPVSLNLASMIAAQVALNYGLFCNEITFRGLYNEADRKFLQEMVANTAREIFVLKFLHPNPFLKAEVAHLPDVKLENFARAKLNFAAEPGNAHPSQSNESWSVASERYAVLSSGGKDSLLSYGLLHEIGVETHPIFVNESGRHWFTALNAYRHFKATVPETARVWTNADRLFAWMLRHLPFVRQDFSRIRSDEYPIRLWTVAVFLFGALPIMRKRGIGRLVIGDEYDTTVRSHYNGISHYNGLYDQSRYFDKALTRYFLRKGWGVNQLSLIRSLSELLIEKILATRYPDLQQHQLSCHAAHTEGERIRPCGNCEKCRRIVGMLLAVGADPKHCGYTEEQIHRCIHHLAEKGVHQEAAGAQHLVYLLESKALIPKGGKKHQTSKPHPEIMKVRIDPERSPIEEIPRELREPLFDLFLQHADGAVQKHGRVWRDLDLLNASDLSKPYPFEKKASSASRENSGKRSYILGELTWPQAKNRLRETDLALLPVGAIEQHGLHLPLDTDAFDADYLAREVAARCSDPKPLVLPLVPYGVSYHHEDFSGTISVTNETLSRFVYEIGVSAARHGITKLVIINGHGGNAASLEFAAQMINRDAHIFTCVDTGETSDTDISEIADTPNDVHAGEIETSTTLAIRPELVDMGKAKKFVPQFSSRYLNFSTRRSVEWNARTLKISKTGVLGDPTKASAEKGEKIWEVMIRNLVEFVEQLKGMTLDEIYEKRY